MKAQIASLIVMLSATACSLGRNTPVLEQYVLGGAPIAQTAPAGTAPGLAVGVRRLDLAPYLAVPAIIVRRGEHQIVVSQYHRWGEDLDAGISRAVARYLTATPAVRSADVAPWPLRAPHDFLVQIRVSRFEGTAAEGAMEGGAHMSAAWQIIQSGGGAVLARGDTNFNEPGWTVGDYAGLVTRLDRGVGQLATDIAVCLAHVAASGAGGADAPVPALPISCTQGDPTQ
jgi:uncharacterized protein